MNLGFIKTFIKNTSLKFIALCLTVTCLVIWQTQNENSYYKLPAKNPLELNIYFFAIPTYTVVLSGLVLLDVLAETPHMIAQRVLSTVGFSVFTVSGTIGVINCTDPSLSRDMQAIAILCCATALVLVLEFLRIEHFFKTIKETEDAM